MRCALGTLSCAPCTRFAEDPFLYGMLTSIEIWLVVSCFGVGATLASAGHHISILKAYDIDEGELCMTFRFLNWF